AQPLGYPAGDPGDLVRSFERFEPEKAIEQRRVIARGLSRSHAIVLFCAAAREISNAGNWGDVPSSTLPKNQCLRRRTMSSILTCMISCTWRLNSFTRRALSASAGFRPWSGTGGSTRTCHFEGIGMGASG